MLNVISDLTRNLEQYSFCNFWSMYSSFFFDRKLKGDNTTGNTINRSQTVTVFVATTVTVGNFFLFEAVMCYIIF